MSLNDIRALTFDTAFVKRPREWGDDAQPDPVPNSIHDIVVDDFPGLAKALGVTV